MHNKFENFYLLKISLDHSQPEIWRRFFVPAQITLDRLHDVIQIVMGWKDCHLHQFIVGKKKYTEYPESKEDGLPDGKFVLKDLIKRQGQTFEYIYDFGDSWAHTIVLEDNNYANRHLDCKIECLEGENACPPEDVGGIHGFMEFCKAMKDKKHEDHEHYREWYGELMKIEEFPIHNINDELNKYERWARERPMVCLPFYM